MILRLAWKNVWRNKSRSFVMLAAIVIGLTGSTFLVGFMNGWVKERIDDVIESEMTHLQINSSAFIDQPDTEFGFSSSIESSLRSISGIKGVSPRVIVNGMVASAHKTLGIQVYGIDPKKEEEVSGIYRHIADTCGNYFAEVRPLSAVIGADLAEELHVKLNSKIVVSVVNLNGEQVDAAFRVCGIYNLHNPQFEKSRLFVQADDLRSLTGVAADSIHEFAISLADNSDELALNAKQKVEKLLPEGVTVRTWKEISMMMAVYTQYLSIELMILVSLVLAALGFGIVNTILMSVMERTRELSMLMAIGMTRKQVRALIMTETTLLTVTGGLIGMIVGMLLIVTTAQTGIDISASMASVGEMGFPTLIHPYISISLFFTIAILVVLTGIVAAIYPARHATSLNPAEGIRK